MGKTNNERNKTKAFDQVEGNLGSCLTVSLKNTHEISFSFAISCDEEKET